jgi:hypothetical protein
LNINELQPILALSKEGKKPLLAQAPLIPQKGKKEGNLLVISLFDILVISLNLSLNYRRRLLIFSTSKLFLPYIFLTNSHQKISFLPPYGQK